MPLRLEQRDHTREHAQAGSNPTPDPDKLQGDSPTTRNAIIGIILLSVLVVLFLLTYFTFRYFRKNYDEPPPWFPKFLKKRWKKWPSVPTGSTAYSRARAEDSDRGAAGVDRTTSVRSIMTLPEYRAIANPDKERTIAREGERGGMDIVIEFPETQDEEETRRDEHMQTLYEIRLARSADREERRARREARRRGQRLPSNSSVVSTASVRPRTASGTVAPQVLGGGVSSLLNVEAGDSPRAGTPAVSARVQDVLASRSASSLAALIAEPPARLSQVGYADIGIARPDGSRVRENSISSDRQVLLGDAASMGNTHSRQGSSSSLNNLNPPYNQSSHARSASNLSVTTYATASMNISTPSLPRTARRGSGDSFQFVQVHGHSHGRQSSDLTEMRIANPPDYERLQFEDAPPYESPVRTRLEVPPLTPAEQRRSSLGPSGDLTSPNTVIGRASLEQRPYGNGGI